MPPPFSLSLSLSRSLSLSYVAVFSHKDILQSQNISTRFRTCKLPHELSFLFTQYKKIKFNRCFLHSLNYPRHIFSLSLSLSLLISLSLSLLISLSLSLSSSSPLSSPVGWGSRICWLHLCRGVRSFQTSLLVWHWPIRWISNFQSALLRRGTRPDEWGAQWDSNSLV